MTSFHIWKNKLFHRFISLSNCLFFCSVLWMDSLLPVALLLVLRKLLHTTIFLRFSSDLASHETLSIQQFISFRLPSLQTRLKNPSSCLSSKQPSMDTLSEAEDDLRSLVRPTRLDMKRLEILIPLLSLLQFYDCSIPPSPHPIGPSSDFMSSYILTYILGFWTYTFSFTWSQIDIFELKSA